MKWLEFGPASGWGGIYVGSHGPARAGSDVADVPGCAGVSPYPSRIRTGYEGCQPVRAFETRLMRPSGSKFCDRPMTGLSARAYRACLGRPAVDALSNVSFHAHITITKKTLMICLLLQTQNSLAPRKKKTLGEKISHFYSVINDS